MSEDIEDTEDNEETLPSNPDEEMLVAAMRDANKESEDDDPDVSFKRALEALFAPQEPIEKPDIECLDDAVIDSPEIGKVFIPQAGDGLIIEYPQPWRETKYFVIQDVDYDTGNVRLWDPAARRQHGTNYITGQEKWELKLKLPAPNTCSTKDISARLNEVGMKKRCKRAVSKIIAQQTETNHVVKKSRIGRGRPAGSKNRSKDVIEEEKKERNVIRAARANKQELRKRARIARRAGMR